MKRWFVIFAFTALLVPRHDAAAADAESSAARKSADGGALQRFVDEDGDGLNDLVSDSDGDGIPNESSFGHARSEQTRPAQGTGEVQTSGSVSGGLKVKGGSR